MIKFQIVGNLGKDVLQNQVNGKTVLNVSIAHQEKYKDAQGVAREKTTWVEGAYWTEKVGIAPYLKKGTLIYAEGTPDLKQYTRNDGTAGATLVLRISMIQLLGSKPEGSQTQQQPQNEGHATHSANGNQEVDDLPF